MMYCPNQKEIDQMGRLDELQRSMRLYAEIDADTQKLQFIIPNEAPEEVRESYKEWCALKEKIEGEAKRRNAQWNKCFPNEL